MKKKLSTKMKMILNSYFLDISGSSIMCRKEYFLLSMYLRILLYEIYQLVTYTIEYIQIRKNWIPTKYAHKFGIEKDKLD